MSEPYPAMLRRPRVLVGLVFLLSLCLCVPVIWQLEAKQLLVHREAMARRVENHGFLIRDSLQQALTLNYSLAALVRLHKGDTRMFTDFAQEVLPNYTHVSHLSLAPQGVISQVYPQEGNESSLGMDLFRHPQQRYEALLARDTGLLTLAGPVELVQGSTAVVGRLPVFIDENGSGSAHFWGTTNVAIRLSQLISATNLQQLGTQGIAYKLWRTNPTNGREQVLASYSLEHLQDPVHLSIPVANGAWVLSTSPVQGWFQPWRLVGELSLALLFSSLLAYLSYLLIQLQRRKLSLQTAVTDQTRELVNARTQLQATLDAIPDLLFDVGSDGIIYQFHTRRPELLFAPADNIIGRPFSHITPPDVNRIVWEAMDEAAREGLSEGKWYQLALPSGVRYFELSVSCKAGLEQGIQRFIMLSRDITERKENEAHINNLAFFDPLTQLPNRRLLQDRLEQALHKTPRSHSLGALLYIDLDDFKSLNDNRGHHVGDLLLAEVGKRLRKSLRAQDTVGRRGGDEFLVILEGLAPRREQAAAQAQHIGEKILQALNQPYYLEEQEYFNTPSIGICLFGDSSDNIDDLLKQADQAMYHAKGSGRNTLRFFDPNMQASATQRFALQQEIREAINHNQFILYYQPQVSQQAELLGVEALVRWQHPQRGLISPQEFIPLAEDCGLILPLGNWILEAACKQLVAWSQHPATAQVSISVNVSARQFQHANFVDQVLSAITSSKANAQQLILELTESMLATNQHELIIKMETLRSHGIRFSLDDFGTGYSSLAYLKRLPINELKIDRSFIKDIPANSNDAAIAKLIIRLAKSLELNVIAEGVEIQEQCDWLATNGCHRYQGFLFGKPVPPEKLCKERR